MANRKSPRDRRKSARTLGEIADLIEKCRQGDAAAEEQVFSRYVNRLTALARSRLSRKLAARFDADDVVMSAYRSFFVGLRDRGFAIAEEAELWQLLVQITLRKLYRQAARHRAAKRSAAREQHNSTNALAISAVSAREPRPDEAAAIADEVEHLLGQIPPAGRRIVELRLQGDEIDAIAAQVQVNERTVRRWLNRAKNVLVSRGAPRHPLMSRNSSPTAHSLVEQNQENVDARLASRPRRRRQSFAEFPTTIPVLEYGDFVLRCMIGIGTSGKVYRASSLRDGQSYALKFLRKAFISDRRAVERFIDELSIVATLKHPNIMRVRGCGRTSSGGYFFAMELAAGDIQSRRDHRRIAVGQAVEWLMQAAKGVQHAHENGVIHRDLKPSNLLLSPDDSVLVSDFGLACRIDQMTLEHRLAGTPAFMAPEQVVADGRSVSHASDIYGLGAVLYAMLTGRPPFRGERLSEVLAEVASSALPIAPSRIRQGISKEIEQACMRCLAKNPADRFPSVGALLHALEECKL
jgi:RNA polymerase sigma factor (sigma-70 family)